MPEKAIPFKYAIPLAEILAYVRGLTGEDRLYSKDLWQEYLRIVGVLGPEFRILLESDYGEIEGVAGSKVAEAVRKIREGTVRLKPGFDGVYGELRLFEEAGGQTVERKSWTGLDAYLE